MRPSRWAASTDGTSERFPRDTPEEDTHPPAAPSPSDPSYASTTSEEPVVERRYLVPFVLVTSLFALWGFANDVTNPLVRAFREIFLISNAQSAWVQMAFYGGYATMALPAALLIRRYSYKTGIVLGLMLYAAGALLTVPAANAQEFTWFLVGFYVLTFGLAFLETSANPYVLSLGNPRTATRRLNLAQAFNPVGSLSGMLVASLFVLPNLSVSRFRTKEKNSHPEYADLLPSDVDARIELALRNLAQSQPETHEQMVRHDLDVVAQPYLFIALAVVGVLLVFLFTRLPEPSETRRSEPLSSVLSALGTNRTYLAGVLAQTFYVGAQIMCWTFIIHYGMTLLGLSAAEAQNYNIVAMVLFLASRFFSTYLLRFLKPGQLLASSALAGSAACLGAIFFAGPLGLYCLVAVSACMSPMFPTIYGIALDGLSEDRAKLGSAGLIFAIVGGALMPRLQGELIDGPDFEMAGRLLESVRVSFVLPVLCFLAIGIYGFVVAASSQSKRSTGPTP